MKKMILVATMLVVSTTLFAQRELNANQKNRELDPQERIENRVQRVSSQLMLEDKNEVEFKEIYTEYLTAKQNVMSQTKAQKPEAPMSDDQITQMIEARFDNRQAILDIDKKYFEKFEKILNAKQLQELYSKRGGKKKMVKAKGKQNKKEGKRDMRSRGGKQ